MGKLKEVKQGQRRALKPRVSLFCKQWQDRFVSSVESNEAVSRRIWRRTIPSERRTVCFAVLGLETTSLGVHRQGFFALNDLFMILLDGLGGTSFQILFLPWP